MRLRQRRRHGGHDDLGKAAYAGRVDQKRRRHARIDKEGGVAPIVNNVMASESFGSRRFSVALRGLA